MTPLNEDSVDYEAVITVCRCSLEKAKKEWEAKFYTSFKNDILAYGKLVESSTSSKATLIASVLPEKSESLVQDLKKLIPYIEKCEEKFDTYIEF